MLDYCLGQIVITKNIKSGNPAKFVAEVAQAIDFPAQIMVDFAGFFKGKPPNFEPGI